MVRVPAAERRQALIEAALRVMARDGVAAASTRAIVAEAGMPLATFHYCFRGRDEMLAELIGIVVRREVDAALAAMELPVAAQPSERRAPGPNLLGELLRGALSGYLRHLEANPDHELVLFELNHYALRTPELRGLATEQYRLYYQAAEQVLAVAARRADVGWLTPLPALARLVITVLDGATTTWLVDRDSAATLAALTHIADLLVTMSAQLAAVPPTSS